MLEKAPFIINYKIMHILDLKMWDTTFTFFFDKEHTFFWMLADWLALNNKVVQEFENKIDTDDFYFYLTTENKDLDICKRTEKNLEDFMEYYNSFKI